MPRHEIVVKRIPDEFQGKPVRLPDPLEVLGGDFTQTVAEYRASHPILRQTCPSCDLSFGMSSLEPVLDAWGPDAVISVSLSCHWVPGEPHPEPGAAPEFLRKRARRRRGTGGSETGNGPAGATGPSQ